VATTTIARSWEPIVAALGSLGLGRPCGVRSVLALFGAAVDRGGLFGRDSGRL